MIGEDETTIAALRDAAVALRSVTTSAGDELRAIETAIRVLQAAKCARLAEMHETKAHEADGASSIATWARRELHQDASTTRQMVRAAATFGDLPDVGDAARAGRLSYDHVKVFSYALKHVGVDETRQLEAPLLDLATTVAPSELFAKVRQTKDVLHSEDLDQAWLEGLEKRDIRITRCGDGWHLTGFLDVETGAKLKTILDNLSVPRSGEDTRHPAARRMDALDEICTTVLEHGLPADNGIRPHLFVTVEAPTTDSPLEMHPAVLEGFGHVGPQLLAHLACGAEITPFLVRTDGAKNVEVLDVGRTERYATLKQAKAIRLRQRGKCASPGCSHPIAHNHHKQWWSRGGRTDLDNLIGLCRKCHTLVHAGQLELAA